MAYSTAICDNLRALLDQMSIKYRFEEEGDLGTFTIQMKLRCRLQNARMIIIVRENNFSTLTTIPLSADENYRLAVAEYLTRANFNMRNGNFELNMEDGEIRFKTYFHAGEEHMDINGARLCILLPFLMIDRYGDGLLEVLFGFKSPKEAFDAAAQK